MNYLEISNIRKSKATILLFHENFKTTQNTSYYKFELANGVFTSSAVKEGSSAWKIFKIDQNGKYL